MKIPCTVSRMRHGTWLVRHSSSSLGNVEVSAASPEEDRAKRDANLDHARRLERAAAGSPQCG
jgi:hypothetical protein